MGVAAGNLWLVRLATFILQPMEHTNHKFPAPMATGVPSEVKSTRWIDCFCVLVLFYCGWLEIVIAVSPSKVTYAVPPCHILIPLKWQNLPPCEALKLLLNKPIMFTVFPPKKQFLLKICSL